MRLFRLIRWVCALTAALAISAGGGDGIGITASAFVGQSRWDTTGSGFVPSLPAFSDPPTAAEITRARVFEEPLLAVGGAPTAAENGDLASAITHYLTAGVPDGTAEFEAFVLAHPDSPWRASLLTDLGLVWRRTGHFSKAYRAWDTAWELAKENADGPGRAVGDRALGERMELLSRLGRRDALADAFTEIANRNVRGSASAKVSSARQALWLMDNEPGESFRCGPLALEALLRAGRAATYQIPDLVHNHKSTANGTSLLEMRDLASAAGAATVIAHRSRGTAIIVPAIVHWNVGHFAALVEQHGDKVLLRDPTFGDEFWLNIATLDEEASGYFLVLNQPLPDGWEAVDDTAGDQIWGKGIVAGVDPTDPNAPRCPRKCGGGSGPGSGGGGNGPGGGGGGNGPGSPPSGPNPGPPAFGMAVMSLDILRVSVTVTDTPLWYTPPKGPSVAFTLSYDQRESLQPQTFSYGNLGTKWTFESQSYVTDDPTNPAAALTVYLRGGGQETSTGYNAATGAYNPTVRTQAVITRVSTTPIRYERQLPDGSVEVFGQPDGAGAFPRKVFLTAQRDPQGNALTFGYDTLLRLTSITDALGQTSTLAYEQSDPLKITKITDPFGRTAIFSYDSSGRLQSITDLLGLTSSFAYGLNDTVSSITTPYGVTRATWGEEGLVRWAEIADPLGGRDRVQYGTGVSFSDPPSTIPAGMGITNNNLDHHNTLYWDKQAMATAAGDPTAATDYFWALVSSGAYQASSAALAIKKPRENRVWYQYQGGNGTEGSIRQVVAIGRVIDDGSSQISRFAYNSRGRITQAVDPLGRETDYVYDATGLDLLQITHKNGTGVDVLASRTYNAQHEPLTMTDAAGQTTTLTYNAAGQIATVMNAKQETTTYMYDANGYLQSITAALPGATTTFGYDPFGRVSTVTDSEGYAVTTTFDVANRPTIVTYPDGTTERMTYNRLDPASRIDRLGRMTRLTYDANRRLTATRDALGRTVTQDWCTCGSLAALVDANGNRTSWIRDVQGRLTQEMRADGSSTLYAYETTTSRVHQVTDPKGQVTTYTYNRDDAVQQMTYTNATIATPSVSFTYDPVYARVTAMVDGTGTTTYAYHPVTSGHLGAGQVATVDGPLTDDTITYGYDEVGRATSRAINGVEATTTYDAIGRTSSETNVLGTFTFTYIGNSRRLATITYPNGQTSTYDYFGHAGDDRLQTIHNKYPDATTLSKFDYTYDASGNILTGRQQTDSNPPTQYIFGYDPVDQLTSATKETTDPTPAVLQRYVYSYDPAGNRTGEQIGDVLTGASYNGRNQLISEQPSGGLLFGGTVSEPAAVTINGRPATVKADNTFLASVPIGAGTTTATIVATDPSGNVTTKLYDVDSDTSTQTFTYDANGNLTSDGTRTLEWDARNQVVAVNLGAHRSEFTYDGLQRRVREVEKENNVVQSDIRVLWCGTEICEERGADATTVTRRAFRRGEQVAGDVSHYFAGDHLRSVSEVTDGSGAFLARYAFDPWGRRTLVAGTDVTRVGFTGHRWQPAESLWLTPHRVLDSETGRWNSEDPIGLKGGINLYAYASDSPVNRIDLLGLSASCGLQAVDTFVKCTVGFFTVWDFAANAMGMAGCMALGPAAAPCIEALLTATDHYEIVAVTTCVLIAIDEYHKCKECEQR